MPHFRKKPVVIEAILYTGSNADEIREFVGIEAWVDIDGLHIHTLEGEMDASPGDWIIRGVKNEFYPCKPDIFDLIYDLVV